MSENQDLNTAEEFEEVVMSPDERAQQVRRAEKVLKNQQHIVKAAKAYARLANNEDFKTMLTHLDNTALHLVKDAPKRSHDAQRHDAQVLNGIATVVSLLEDLPSVGANMERSVKDTEGYLLELKSGK